MVYDNGRDTRIDLPMITFGFAPRKPAMVYDNGHDRPLKIVNAAADGGREGRPPGGTSINRACAPGASTLRGG